MMNVKPGQTIWNIHTKEAHVIHKIETVHGKRVLEDTDGERFNSDYFHHYTKLDPNKEVV